MNYLLEKADALLSQLQQYRDWDSRSVDKATDIEYTYDSNRIEGNTLTLRETDLVINKGLTIGGKPLVEHLEAINHYEAVELIREMACHDAQFNRHDLLTLYALVLRGIDKQYAGRFRDIPVMISGSRHTPPQLCLLERHLRCNTCQIYWRKKGCYFVSKIFLTTHLHGIWRF